MLGNYKKYRVAPITEVYSSVNNSLILDTCDKKEALKYAEKLKGTFKEVSFNVDTYIEGICTKNEFGYFINTKEINIYSVTDYTKKKKVKPIIINPKMFFDL